MDFTLISPRDFFGLTIFSGSLGKKGVDGRVSVDDRVNSEFSSVSLDLEGESVGVESP